MTEEEKDALGLTDEVVSEAIAMAQLNQEALEASIGRLSAQGRDMTTNAIIQEALYPASPRGEFDDLFIDQISPSPENDLLYVRPDPTSVAHQDLVRSIQEHGIREPLVVTADYVVVSGHRRLAAAKEAFSRVPRPSVPCRILDRDRAEYSYDDWLVLVREHNRSRVKTLDEALREEVVSADPEVAYSALIEERKKRRAPKVEHVPLRESKARKAISSAKDEFADAVVRVLNEMRNGDFLPISLRRIHYLLLNDPPLTHASKPNSRYDNTPASYKKLCDLVIRLRFEGKVSWEDISDSTRPQTIWQSNKHAGEFVREQLHGLFSHYQRDLLQSQPDHVELVVEKNTVEGILSQVAGQYTMTVTSGRGYCSGRPRYDMAQRFKRSGKRRLVLLLVSDHDPDGEEISHSFARSMRDEFDLEAVEAYRVALTNRQVRQYRLVPGGKAKTGSHSYERFVELYGDDVYELEALPPADLQSELRKAIEGVIDIDRFNQEIVREKEEAGHLATRKAAVLRILSRTE